MKKIMLLMALIFLCGQTIQMEYANAATKTGTISYLGGTYKGQLKDGKPHGDGTLTWGTTKKYKGKWVAGKRSGYGKYIISTHLSGGEDQYTYSGNWKKDRMNGKGVEHVYDYTGEEIYSGSFINGLRNGQGKLEYSLYNDDLVEYENGTYTGLWKNGLKEDSKGKLNVRSGISAFEYLGPFKKGLRNGTGIEIRWENAAEVGVVKTKYKVKYVNDTCVSEKEI
jgi:hypothetical protein